MIASQDEFAAGGPTAGGHAGGPPPRCDDSWAQSGGILLVEDEAIVALDLALQLRHMDYRVTAVADSGDEAIALAAKLKPTVILMDVVIKGDLDGIEVAQRLQAFCDAPVIFLTAFSDKSTVKRAAATAPYGFLTKPFQANQVRAGIEMAISKHAGEKKLRESERWFSATMDSMVGSVIAVDTDQCVQFLNSSAEETLGIRRGLAKGRKLEEVLLIESLDENQDIELELPRVLRDRVQLISDANQHLISPDGTATPVEHRIAPIEDSRGDLLGALIELTTVGKRIEAYEGMRLSEERFRAAFNLAPVGMALLSIEKGVLRANPALCALLQRDQAQLQSLARTELMHAQDVVSEDSHLSRLISGEVQAVEYETRFLDPAGNSIWTLNNASLFRRKGVPVCFIVQVSDMRARKKAEEKILEMARTDSLTGLANRRSWREIADAQLDMATAAGQGLGVVFLDVDHFKHINDTFGHATGDQILREVANRLRQTVRESGVVARFGGDEFVILLNDIGNIGDAIDSANGLLDAVRGSYESGGRQIALGTSLGLAVFPDHGRDMTSLLQAADTALYEAKTGGRNCLRVFDEASGQ
jgi:diguanylate cyclase (GGDEF)-like protein/PAS domain S-box-containing protein